MSAEVVPCGSSPAPHESQQNGYVAVKTRTCKTGAILSHRGELRGSNSRRPGGPWRDGKQSVYEGGLRVAAIARWPGQIVPGSETNLQAMSMDIFPTALEAAGTTCPHEIDGVLKFSVSLGGPPVGVRGQGFRVRGLSPDKACA